MERLIGRKHKTIRQQKSRTEIDSTIKCNNVENCFVNFKFLNLFLL